MTTETKINVRVDKEDKEKANAIFKSLGMNMSTAINMFIKQTILTNSVPLTLDKTYLENMKANDVLNDKQADTY